MEANLKQIGQNLIFTLDGNVSSKKFENKEDREQVKSLYEEFKSAGIKKRKDSLIKQILKFFTKEQEKKKESEKIVKKVSKKIDKNAKQSKTNIDKLEKENKELKEKLKNLENKTEVKQKTSNSTRNTYGGEHNRY